MLIPTLGRHPTKGWIDFRWKHLGEKGFVAAFGPPSWSSFKRFILWRIKKRWAGGMWNLGDDTTTQGGDNAG